MGDVNLDEGRFPAVFGNDMDRLLSTIFVHICHDEFGTFSRKGQRRGSSNP